MVREVSVVLREGQGGIRGRQRGLKGMSRAEGGSGRGTGEDTKGLTVCAGRGETGSYFYCDVLFYKEYKNNKKINVC